GRSSTGTTTGRSPAHRKASSPTRSTRPRQSLAPPKRPHGRRGGTGSAAAVVAATPMQAIRFQPLRVDLIPRFGGFAGKRPCTPDGCAVHLRRDRGRRLRPLVPAALDLASYVGERER